MKLILDGGKFDGSDVWAFLYNAQVGAMLKFSFDIEHEPHEVGNYMLRVEFDAEEIFDHPESFYESLFYLLNTDCLYRLYAESDHERKIMTDALHDPYFVEMYDRLKDAVVV